MERQLYYHLNVSNCTDGEPPKSILYASPSKSQENTASHCERLGVVYSRQYQTANIEEVGIRFPNHQTQATLSFGCCVVLSYPGEFTTHTQTTIILNPAFAKMEPSAALNLPLEVLDVIFQLLRDNTESLKACLLVNRAFLNIVESHLYHHIDIYFGYRIKDGQSTLPVSKLSDLLYGSPHISHHIRSLRIVFPPLPSMVQGDEGLSTILPRLQRLRTISLTTHYHWVLWRTIPEPLQAALLVTIQSSNTEEVDIELVDDFPLQSLNECSNLRKLSFSRIESFRPEDAQTDAAIGRDSPCVKSLAVGYCASALPNLFGWLLAPTPQGKPMISSLRSFVFRTINSQDMKWLVPMLNACLKTLVSLEFDASEICRSRCTHLSSPYLSHALIQFTHLLQ